MGVGRKDTFINKVETTSTRSKDATRGSWPSRSSYERSISGIAIRKDATSLFSLGPARCNCVQGPITRPMLVASRWQAQAPILMPTAFLDDFVQFGSLDCLALG